MEAKEIAFWASEMVQELSSHPSRCMGE